MCWDDISVSAFLFDLHVRGLVLDSCICVLGREWDALNHFVLSWNKFHGQNWPRLWAITVAISISDVIIQWQWGKRQVTWFPNSNICQRDGAPCFQDMNGFLGQRNKAVSTPNFIISSTCYPRVSCMWPLGYTFQEPFNAPFYLGTKFQCLTWCGWALMNCPQSTSVASSPLFLGI